MAEHKCPLCGKENDEHAEECVFCGASLTPLFDAGQDKTSSMDDILASLRGSGEEQAEAELTSEENGTAEAPGINDLSSSDFLDRLREIASDQPDPLQLQPEPSDEDIPDWLKELETWKPGQDAVDENGLAGLGAEEAVFSEADNALPPWLSDAQEKAGPAEEVPPLQMTGEEARAHVLAEWLAAQRELQAREKVLPAEQTAEEETFIDLPEIFPEAEAAPAEDAENGMTESAGVEALAAEEPQPDAPQDNLPIPAAETPPIELGGPAVQPEAAAETELPDTPAEAPQAGMETTETGPELPEIEPVSPEAVMETPEAGVDSLAGVSGQEIERDEPLTEITQPAVAEAQPQDTLEPAAQETSQPAGGAGASAAGIEEPVPQIQHPDDAGGPVSDEEILPSGEELAPTAEAEIPFVLSEPAAESQPQLEAESAAPDATAFPADQAQEPGPEMSQEERSAFEKFMQEPIEAPVRSNAPFPEETESLAVSEGETLHEWLSKLQTENFPPVFDLSTPEPSPADGAPDDGQTADQLPPPAPPFINGDLSGWLESAPAESVPDAGEQSAAQPKIMPSEPLPEWMENITPEKAEVSAEAGAAADGAAAGAVDETLPAWLTALQPLTAEPPGPAETAEAPEDSPLAGIPGVLPVVNAGVLFRKPPVFSTQVVLSEQQKANAQKLENLVSGEKETLKKKRIPRSVPYGLFRTLIGILMIGLMTLPLFEPFSTLLETALPAAGAPAASVAAFRNALEALPEETTVLVAVEYAPGYDGELRDAAAALLQKLMAKNVHIAVVSTNVSGPLLAENLKAQTLRVHPELSGQYDNTDWFINLGYLPGETLSLQELAADPHQAVQFGLRSGLENRLVWDSAGLFRIRELSDFSMLVVITDTIETGKAWIEQVQPGISDTPVLVLSSAQAAPMLQPYAESGQIDGLLSGMAGGLSLQENDTGSDETGHSSVLYLAGVGAAVLLILAGFLLEIVRSVIGRKQAGQEVS